MTRINRRDFVRELGLTAAAGPFLMGLSSVSGAPLDPAPKRLIIMFSPNGTIQDAFWPDEAGPLAELKPILQPLEPYRQRTTILKGISNLVRGDGDSHMRGMSCLLTGTELTLATSKGVRTRRPVGPKAFPSTRKSATSCSPTKPPGRGLAAWNSAWPYLTGPIPGPA